METDNLSNAFMMSKSFLSIGTNFRVIVTMLWLAILSFYLPGISFWNGFAEIGMARRHMKNYFLCAAADIKKILKIKSTTG